MAFRYNPVHDLEALWWISVYFNVACAIVDDGSDSVQPPEIDPEQLKRQQDSAARLLRGSIDRYEVMSRNGAFAEEVWSIHPAIRRFWPLLDTIRVSVADAYRYIEQDMGAREFKPPTEVYNTMQREFLRIMDDLEKKDVKIGPLSAAVRTS